VSDGNGRSGSTGNGSATDPGRPSDPFLILGIETSCDETAAAIVANGSAVISSVVSSQIDLHARFGGVVPELASRAHVELLTPVVAEVLVESGVNGDGIDAVAATVGPGLVGSLLVGISAAKALALVWDVPFIGVDHMEGHLYASFLEAPDLELPVLVMLVSGGHTMLILMEGHGRYQLLGTTVDDAVGEAYDKVARFLGLGYPGGPAIDKIAVEGDPEAVKFPRPMLNDGLDFSFSGLKTSVVTYVRGHPETSVADVSASFQAAVVDVLITKALRAAEQTGVNTVCLGGGVAANSLLRERMAEACAERGLRAFVPSREMCTDNAAMVAAAAWWRYQSDGPTPLDAGAAPNLRLV
jgi:N6-L-threonylcarbamoyladenine synthase